MKDLIERLEKATEGNRALDALIAVHLGYWGWTPEKWAEALKDPRLNPDGACPDGTPQYTTSLDAAMTLVPEGYGWNAGRPIQTYVKGHYATVFREMTDEDQTRDDAWWNDYDHKDTIRPRSSYRPTAAIALCIAALKAKEST